MSYLNKQLDNKSSKNKSYKLSKFIKWIIIYLVISIVFLFSMPFRISSDEDGNLVTNYKSINVDIVDDIGNTDEIQNLNTNLINDKGVKLCVLAVNSFITDDHYLEAGRVFNTYDKFDKNTIFMYVSKNDKEVIIRAGENANKVFSRDIYSTCIELSYDYFKEGKYNEGIEEMAKYLINQDKIVISSKSKNNYFNNVFNIHSALYAFGVSFFLTIIIFITIVIMKKLASKSSNKK